MNKIKQLHFISSHFFIVYGLLFLLFISNVFIDSFILHQLISWCAVLILLLSWFWASNLFKGISTFFIVTGAFMSLWSKTPWYEIPGQTSSTLPMLVFLSVLPWMSAAFSVGEYDQKLGSIIQSKTNQLSDLYGKGLYTTYSLLIFINISAIYVAQQILMEKLKNVEIGKRNDFIIQTTLRAFSLAVIWSPMEIVVGMTVDATNISFLTYLPWLILCSFLIAMIDVLISKKQFTGIQVDTKELHIDKKTLWIALSRLFIVLFLFLSTIVIINELYQLNFILTVSLIIFPFAFIWSMFMRSTAMFLKGGWQSWQFYNNRMQNLVVLFLSLAFFSNGFNQTNLPNVLQSVLNQISGYSILIFIFITVVYFTFAMVGVHPIATLAILIEILRPLFGILNPLSIGIVLIVSGLASSASAPYGINATLTSQQLGINPYHITKKNFLFSILMSTVGIVIAMALL
nr:hypothetical protein [Fredinandcohnia onubensis]